MLPLTSVSRPQNLWLRSIAISLWKVGVSTCRVCGLNISLWYRDSELTFSSKFERTVILIRAVVAIIISEPALTLSDVLIMRLLL